VAALGLLALFSVYDVLSASPKACSSCHEMVPRARAWTRSAHGEIVCVNCHTGPFAWYYGPRAVAARTALLLRCASSHVAGGYQDPVETRSPGVEPMADAICLQCHDPNRKATSGFRIKIQHAEHAERNGSCVSCHVRTAHPLPTKSRPLTLMSQCFTCHGLAKDAKAPGECGVCHPKTYDLEPGSHRTRFWEFRHGVVATEDRAQCDLCHRQQFCDDCHGVTIPHPEDWTKGKDGHATKGAANPQVCVRCHPGGTQVCNQCHHDAFRPGKGTWLVQHKTVVRKEGTAYCMKCHEPAFCTRCHSKLPSAAN